MLPPGSVIRSYLSLQVLHSFEDERVKIVLWRSIRGILDSVASSVRLQIVLLGPH
jgi:hypothetical protein